jgi:hypothetical protein
MGGASASTDEGAGVRWAPEVSDSCGAVGAADDPPLQAARRSKAIEQGITPVADIV